MHHVVPLLSSPGQEGRLGASNDQSCHTLAVATDPCAVASLLCCALGLDSHRMSSFR